jgi:hypothetical protein
MNTEALSSMEGMEEIETAARRWSRIASILMALGLLVFVGSIFYSSAQLKEISRQRAELEAIKADNEASARILKERAAQEPPKQEEIQAAKEPATTPEQQQIDALVENLFSKSGSKRISAYDTLTTTSLRTKDYAVEKLLRRGAAELSKPPEDRDFVGIYNAVVTLTDMSRAATQKPEFKDRIADFGDEAVKAFPRLENRVSLLKKWLNSKSR